ncbi:RxLR effector protein [Phytophthora megakarya]|uniref:RxLR effector protein n=1 Tax=Phytophthora megakarya TaxID=4795 RepID=A0A225WBC6_9STRA|nr:RxLR effector protein [Phytophthora megakarya]
MRALRQDQLMRWKDGGNSADDVFKLLKAENVRDDSRMFLVLDDYVKLVNRKKSDPGETLLNTLMKGFKNDEKVGALLYAAKKEPDTMEKALQLENSLLKQWAADRQVPANVFQWLRFDHDVHYAFKADNFKRIVKYADDFKKQEPTFKTSTVELFTNRFPGDVVANKLIRISTMYDTTISSAAKKLQTEQLLSWKSSGKSGDEVVDMFKISTLEPSAITSRKLDAVDEFLKLTGAEQDLIAILTIKFGRLNLARILQSASPTTNITPYQAKQFAAWVKQGITPRNFATALFKKNTELAIENKFKAFYKARQLK